jgi:ABC-type transport system substrate-binding protein
VKGLETPDARTLVIRLDEPYAPFLATLTMPAAFVVPREDVEHLKEDFARRPVGSGAFQFEEYKPAKQLSLVRNPNYFGGAPLLSRVIFHVQPDEEKRFQAFLNGDIHHSTVPDPYFTMVREREGKWLPYLTEVSELGVYYFGMNVTRPPFDDPRVRRAFNVAVDREAIKKYIKSDRVDTAASPLPNTLRKMVRGSDNDPGPMQVPFNLEQADRILTEAGYPVDPATGMRPKFPKLPINVSQDEQHIRIARAIQASLADLGIQSHVAVNPWKEHLAILRRGDSSFFRLGWVADYKDPDNFLYYNFHSRNIGSSNYTRYSNPRVDELLHLARQNTRPAYRAKLYREAEQIIIDDAVWICLFYFKTAVVRQPYVMGMALTDFGEHMIRFDQMWLAPASGRDS